jgi:hypothetical protein
MTPKPQLSLLKLAAAVGTLIGLTLMLGFTSCNQKPASRVLSWGLLDKTTNTNTNLASPGSAAINANDQLIVTLQVQDPDGIKEMDVSGSGTFKCTYIDPKKVIYDCGQVTSALVSKQTTTISSSGSYTGFVMTQPFRYWDIPCGSYQGNACLASGPLHVVGNETSWLGTNAAATLDLNLP